MRRSIGLEEPGDPDIEITRMKRRHIRAVMAIERRVYPRPWTPSLFVSEITAGRTRCYLVALAAGARLRRGRTDAEVAALARRRGRKVDKVSARRSMAARSAI